MGHNGDDFQLIKPGYTELWTDDVKYVLGSGETAGMNVFDPYSARPLLNGEWLQDVAASTGTSRSVTRGGNNAISSSGTADGESSVPSYPYFMEKGRSDVQARRLAHVIIGPVGYMFRTKLVVVAGLAVGDALSVWDLDHTDGVIRRILAKRSSGYGVAKVRAIGTDWVEATYLPGCT
jgi:hypothetical protein